eukprot:SAG31_NODE_1021_length_10327_cov_17.940653_8_plen_67_part_00
MAGRARLDNGEARDSDRPETLSPSDTQRVQDGNAMRADDIARWQMEPRGWGDSRRRDAPTMPQVST